MTTKVWFAAQNGSWDSGSNWDSADGTHNTGIPNLDGSDDVFFNPQGGAPYTVIVGDINGTDAARSLTINDSALTLSIGANALDVMTHTTIAAGTVTFADGILAFGADDGSTLAAGAKVTGFGEIDNQVSGSGTIEATGGTLVLVDPVNVGHLQFQIAPSATLEVSLGVGAGNTFSFEGRNGSLMIDDPAEFHGTVLGLVDGGSSSTPTNSIQLAGSGISATFNPNSNTLDLSDGGTIQLDPSAAYSPTTKAGTASNGSGTELFLFDPTVCFAEGTRVLTDRGEVMVEDLAPGDKVIAVESGRNEARPVRWIGHRHLDLTTHPRAAFAAPVRIRRGAFSDSQPARDLVVSPDHCLFLDGKLIPAKLLINGMTIVQDRHASSVTYYHVELDRHAVLLAEVSPPKPISTPETAPSLATPASR